MNSKPNLGNNTRLIQTLLVIVIALGVGFLFGNVYTSTTRAQGGFDLPTEAEEEFEAFFQTYNLIQQQYIEDIDNITLVNGAISGMVDSLDDRFSSYVDPELFPFVDTRLAGEIEGIGAVISVIEETEEIEIINVLSDTPAERAGLENGDIFVLVNGDEITGLNTTEVAALVRGPVGTVVNLTMRRDDELLEFSIERDRIEIVSVESEMLDNNIGYIRLADFSVNSRRQVDEALAEFSVGELNGLVLDLRGNPGGLLTAATEIAGLFLEEGVILVEQFGDGEERIFEVREGVVYQIFGDGSERVYNENAGYAGVDAPVVVLVDERSASASELVAGAWQDNAVATIMGTVTFGKGTVQIQNTLINGGGVRLTVARWLTPNGAWITDLGITPDVLVEIPEDVELAEGEDPQLDAAISYILEQAPVPTMD